MEFPYFCLADEAMQGWQFDCGGVFGWDVAEGKGMSVSVRREGDVFHYRGAVLVYENVDTDVNHTLNANP